MNRETLDARLRELGMTREDLAKRAGLSVSYIYKLLMRGPGRRENPSRQVLERIAAAVGLLPSELDERLELHEYLRQAMHTVEPEQLQSLKGPSAARRFAFVVELMQRDQRWDTMDKVAQALDLPVDTVQAILGGMEPEGELLKHLEEQTGLSIRWWVRGRLAPNPDLVNTIVEHEDAQEYLEAVHAAMRHQVSPRLLKGFVELIVKGEAS
ncbi:MAG: helix-turn-helix transcriptional regulator [Bacillota bacterium]|nr:MAG: hypothetical protein DIU70_01570 [Bacillota bacterium]